MKTGPGEYGEGDEFIGVTLPKIREAARQQPLGAGHDALEVPRKLLGSAVHEERLLGVVLLDNEARALLKARGDQSQRLRAVFGAFATALNDANVAGRGGANNWDLVDTAAPRVVGGYVDRCGLKTQRSKLAFLRRMATSTSGQVGVTAGGLPAILPESRPRGQPGAACRCHPHLWRRRAGVVASLYFASLGDAATPIAVVAAVLKVELSQRSSGALAMHDLLQKASGWALREAGRRDAEALEAFLDRWSSSMPRTMLRYAVERLSAEKRRRYMAK